MPARAVARVDSGALRSNAAALRARLTGGALLCAVVKANGYGHGAVAAAEAALAGGADRLAVATAAEAAELRAAGIGAPILVMGALSREEAAVALAADADMVVWTESFMAAVADRGARLHVKYDTGMGRLGTADAAVAERLADRIAAHDEAELAGVMTHFATADELGDDHFGRQLDLFARFVDRVRAVHPDTLAHAANSAALLRDPAAHFDMVRAGVALYGLDPFQRDPADHGFRPALALETYVAAVKPFRAGDAAGYGRRWIAPRDTLVATLPIGYGDGWRRALSNGCDVLIGGRRHPLIGTISMDNLTVELGPGSDVEPGAPAILIGSQGDERILAEEVAARLATINYEVTCALGPRVPRVVEP